MKKFVLLVCLTILTANITVAHISGDNTATVETKKGFFSKIFKKKKKDEIPKGYYGKLPDIEADFKYLHQAPVTSSEIDAKIPTDEQDIQDLKKAPYNDALFIDNIAKKEKTSNYINDIQKTKFAFESLKKCIEQQGDIQRFNGCVNVIDLYSKNLQTKYENESDSLRESYSCILNTAHQAKILGNLLYDANYYARYIPTNQGKYSKANIDAQKEALLNKINKTLFVISSEN